MTAIGVPAPLGDTAAKKAAPALDGPHPAATSSTPKGPGRTANGSLARVPPVASSAHARKEKIVLDKTAFSWKDAKNAKER